MPILEDQDADQKYAPHPEDMGVHPEHREAEVDELERMLDGPSAEDHDYSADSGKQLSKKEDKAAESEYGPSFLDRMNDGLTKGHRGDKSKPTTLSNMFGSDSKLKKKAAIAGVLAGGSLIGATFGFMALLPFKIESLVQNLESHFASAENNAIGNEVDNLFSDYVKNSILPSMRMGRCHTTVDPHCVVVPNGTGPVGQLYAAWSKGKLERRLATKYGIVIGMTGSSSNPRYFMNLDGRSVDITALQRGDTRLFDLPGTRQVSRLDIDRAIHNALRNGTLWDRTYRRFTVDRYLKRQYGIKHCMLFCDPRSRLTGKIADKKLAAKALLIQRLVPEKYAVIMQCVLLGGCDTDLSPATAGEEERMSPAQRQIRDTLVSAAARLAGEGIDTAKFAEISREIDEKGLQGYVAKELVQKIISTVITDSAGEAAGQATADAVPVIGWVLIAAQVIDGAGSAGPIIKFMGYAATAATVVAMYESYNTLASECKSGHCDSTALGSFSQALSTNLTGMKEDQSDATSTPWYAKLSGGTSVANKTYLCADGSPVPKGATVCPEEVMTKGNGFANALSKFIKSLGPLYDIAHIINKAHLAISTVIGSTFNFICSGIPGCKQGMAALGNVIGKWVQPLFTWLQSKLITTPLTKAMSGGRIFDMMAGGADVVANSACLTQLGCPRASAATVAKVQNQELAYEQADFQSQPMFARMFDTDSQYSLISQLAVSMPMNLLTVSNDGMATLITNPFSKIGSALSSIFNPGNVFAAGSPEPDPIGVIQNAYDPSMIPAHPQEYYDQHNCGDPNQQTDWLNAMTQDPNTGEGTTTTGNPCLLVKQAIVAGGAAFDPSLIPPDTAATTSGSSTTTSSSASPADCQNGTATGNAKIVCSAYKFDALTYSQSGPRGDWNFLACVNSNFAGTCASTYPAGTAKRTVDCSSMATYAIKDGIGFDMKAYNTAALGGSPYLQKVGWDQAQPGDLVLYPGDHVEIVVSNDTSKHVLNTFGAHTHYATHPADDVSPGTFNYNTKGFSVYRVVPQ